jgi:hypothetical protein
MNAIQVFLGPNCLSAFTIFADVKVTYPVGDETRSNGTDSSTRSQEASDGTLPSGTDDV